MMFAFAFPSRYDSRVTAKSVTGFGDPNSKRRTSATIDGAFLVPVSYGGCAWEGFGPAGFTFWTGSPTCVQSPPSFWREIGVTPKPKGVSPMKHARIASAIRARAHRKMAFAALRSDSSAAVRLKRYNHHMTKARRLEAQEVCS